MSLHELDSTNKASLKTRERQVSKRLSEIQYNKASPIIDKNKMTYQDKTWK